MRPRWAKLFKTRQLLVVWIVSLMFSALVVVFVLMPLYSVVGDTTKSDAEVDAVLRRSEFLSNLLISGAVLLTLGLVLKKLFKKR